MSNKTNTALTALTTSKINFMIADREEMIELDGHCMDQREIREIEAEIKLLKSGRKLGFNEETNRVVAL